MKKIFRNDYHKLSLSVRAMLSLFFLVVILLLSLFTEKVTIIQPKEASSVEISSTKE